MPKFICVHVDTGTEYGPYDAWSEGEALDALIADPAYTTSGHRYDDSDIRVTLLESLSEDEE